MTTSTLTRACVTAGTAGLLVLAAAGTASAHVSASAPDAAQGGYAVVTFRVPNESATATTTGVTVTLPADGGLSSVRTTPIAGWGSTVTKDADGVPTTVTWTAEAGTSVGADQFGQFAISVGPLPEAETITFDAAQTYSDGTVVDWDEAPNADGSEPEHPAPELQLAAATGDAHGAGAHGAGEESAGDQDTADQDVTATAATTTAAPVTAASDTTARWLGGGGLLLGALGLGLGVGAAVRARRSGTPEGRA